MKKLTFVLVALFAFAFTSEAQIRVITNGNTGVGTTTPVEQLHVLGNQQIENSGYVGLFIKESTGSGAAQVRFRSQSAAFVFDNLAGQQQGSVQYDIPSKQLQFINNQAASRLYFKPATAIPMVYTHQGRLGVGVGAPTHNLHVSGNAGKTDGTATWDVLSDRRLKTNISEYTDGLEEVLQIKPVNFEYTGEANTQAGKQVVGVIAQEMMEVAPYMVHEVQHQNETEVLDAKGIYQTELGPVQNYYGYNANALPYMLVNAVQEQQELIEAQAEKIAELETLITNNGIGSINQSEVDLTYSDLAELKQNIPNPFNGSTTIQYTIPGNAVNSTIIITDMAGKVLKNISLNHIGEGQLTINANDIPSGTYSYQLVVDGSVISTKKMVLHQ